MTRYSLALLARQSRNLDSCDPWLNQLSPHAAQVAQIRSGKVSVASPALDQCHRAECLMGSDSGN
jgi:hypothetical protein